jgi:hypothetical protein
VTNELPQPPPPWSGRHNAAASGVDPTRVEDALGPRSLRERVADPRLSPLPVPPSGPIGGPTRRGPRGWRKFFAIVGIVGGFLTFLTIPGWVALSVYRKWESGQREQPNLLIGWGVFCVCSLALVVAVTLVAPTDRAAVEAAPVSDPAAASPSIAGSDSDGEPSPSGFVLTEDAEGWRTYSSSSVKLALSLPEGWEVSEASERVPDLLFSAFDAEAHRELQEAGVRPQFLVARNPVGSLTDDVFRKLLRLAFVRDKRTVGGVSLTTMALPGGLFHVVHAVQRSSIGPVDLTIYSTLRDDAEYRLIFVTPKKGARSHYADFRSMASKFLFTV